MTAVRPCSQTSLPWSGTMPSVVLSMGIMPITASTGSSPIKPATRYAMPKRSAKVDVLISDLDGVGVGSLLVVARDAHRAVALDHRDAAARLGERHAHRVLHRAPFAREIGDGDAARTALVDAPDAVARLRDGEERRRRLHQPPFTWSSFLTAVTPLTCLATASTRRFVSSESTRPRRVTTPLSLSTLMSLRVRKPTSLASAVCTLVVSAASCASSLFFWRPSSVT